MDEGAVRATIRELLATGALGDPRPMPARALSPAPGGARSIVSCRLCREPNADTAFFDRAQRTEIYAHDEPCARLWAEEANGRSS